MSLLNEDNLQKLGIKELTDRFGKTAFRPVTNTGIQAPGIRKEYIEDGVRMYKCDPLPGQKNFRVFIADKYDEIFLPSHGKKMITKKSVIAHRERNAGVAYKANKR